MGLSNFLLGAATMTAGMLFGIVTIPGVDRPFMDVLSVEFKDGIIHANRVVHAERTIADWRVTVVSEGEDAPACQTLAGKNLHEGWSWYEVDDPKASSFTLDEWVGDEGCLSRLEGGAYEMYMTWTPRDGTPSVVFISTFTAP